MAGAIAYMLLEGDADYERGRRDALEGLEPLGPTMFALGSKYYEGYEDGKREKEGWDSE